MSGILFGRRLEFFGRINLVCSFSGARSWVSDGEKWIVFTIDFQISWIFAQNARKRARNIIEQPFQIYSLINLRNQLFFHHLIHRRKVLNFLFLGNTWKVWEWQILRLSTKNRRSSKLFSIIFMDIISSQARLIGGLTVFHSTHIHLLMQLIFDKEKNHYLILVSDRILITFNYDLKNMNVIHHITLHKTFKCVCHMHALE